MPNSTRRPPREGKKLWRERGKKGRIFWRSGGGGGLAGGGPGEGGPGPGEEGNGGEVARQPPGNRTNPRDSLRQSWQKLQGIESDSEPVRVGPSKRVWPRAVAVSSGLGVVLHPAVSHFLVVQLFNETLKISCNGPGKSRNCGWENPECDPSFGQRVWPNTILSFQGLVEGQYGPRRGRAFKGGAPQVGPEGWEGPKISRFFSLSRHHFRYFSLWSVEFWCRFKRREPQMCAFGVLVLSCEAPAAPQNRLSCRSTRELNLRAILRLREELAWLTEGPLQQVVGVAVGLTPPPWWNPRGPPWNEGRKSSFRLAVGHMSFKECWIGDKAPKYKGRAVLRGGVVIDDSGSYAAAAFTEQGSSASQMTVAKVMDIISRLPGCAGQAADAESAKTQVKMEDVPKIGMSRHVYHDTNGQNHGPAWKTQSFLLGEICTVILWQDCYGRGSSRKSYWSTVGREFPIGNAYSYTVKKGYSYLCRWTT